MSDMPTVPPSQVLTPEQARKLGLFVPENTEKVLIWGATVEFADAKCPPAPAKEKCEEEGCLNDASFIVRKTALCFAHFSQRTKWITP